MIPIAVDVEHPEPEPNQSEACRKHIVYVIKHKERDDHDKQPG
jgi:hypothetical protein